MSSDNEQIPAIVCVQAEDSLPSLSELPYIFVTNFNDDATTAFYKSFLDLQAKRDVAIIPIVISSYGGEVYSLLSMLDIMKASTKPCATIALGKAMSCGATLLAAGSKGLRYAAPNADILIHEVASREWGKLTDMINGVEQTKHLNDRLFRLMEGFTEQKRGFFQAQMKKMSNVDWFISAQEAKRLRIVDHVAVPALIKR
jgi:ATP-dependent Clp protease protease subunit